MVNLTRRSFVKRSAFSAAAVMVLGRGLALAQGESESGNTSTSAPTSSSTSTVGKLLVCTAAPWPSPGSLTVCHSAQGLRALTSGPVNDGNIYHKWTLEAEMVAIPVRVIMSANNPTTLVVNIRGRVTLKNSFHPPLVIIPTPAVQFVATREGDSISITPNKSAKQGTSATTGYSPDLRNIFADISFAVTDNSVSCAVVGVLTSKEIWSSLVAGSNADMEGLGHTIPDWSKNLVAATNDIHVVAAGNYEFDVKTEEEYKKWHSSVHPGS